MRIQQLVHDCKEIRDHYHKLENKYHEREWSIEEDALAFLTDAALVGRYTMSKETIWPSSEENLLSYKIGESVWWLCILAERQGLNFEECIEEFISSRKESFNL